MFESGLLNEREPVEAVRLARRRVLTGGAMALAGVALLPGCASMGMGGAAGGAGGGAGMARPSAGASRDVVRRLLETSTRNAFGRLTAPDGFWASSVARINMPVLFGRSPKGMPGVLRQAKFREQLQHRLNVIAEDGARAAAPLVEQTVRSLPIEDADALYAGNNTAATSYLRAQMGPTLVNAMIPPLDRLLKATDDPIISQAVAALKGVDMSDAAHALALSADSAIWYEIGGEEAQIRRDPSSTADSLLTGAFPR